MTRIYFTQFICFLIILSGCKDTTNKNELNSIETISVDIDQHVECFDATTIIDTTYYEIIQLETNDDCMIVEVSRVYFKQNKLFIFDYEFSAVFIFNRDGSYHAKVHAIGQGPGEYASLPDDMVVTDSRIGAIIPVQDKIMFYDFNGRYLEEISMQGSMGVTFFTLDEQTYYLVNIWGIANKGLFNFYELDTRTDKLECYLPFSMKDVKNKRGIALGDYYSVHKDRALFLILTTDTIYEVNPGQTFHPRYYVDIVRYRTPRALLRGSGSRLMNEAWKYKYLIGVNNIAESDKYIFLNIHFAYTTIYCKETKTVINAQHLVVDNWGDFYIHFNQLAYIQQDTLMNILYRNPMLEPDKAEKYIKDPVFKERLSKVFYEYTDEEKNPAIILYKLK